MILEGDKSRINEYWIKPFNEVLTEGAKIAENNLVLMQEMNKKDLELKLNK